ncbi:uncharacterized protein LOC121238899 [Juglans microcarpa x Juglans regia]|uniref:uncharacterized protein LOC121238899 n=1 Tax=Juglans microcarpa x Juglans regia TaxID=2249226 RepID=UPI001B7F6180|nr:uncharacterized protein LOC121238899 [Juglans microcarpa x Juglans regia]
MDADICRWISEFLLRNPVQDHVIKKLLQVLPVSADSRFKKTVLLRTIQADIADAWLTETTLDKLEMIEQLDRGDGVEISDSLKVAYCTVAVECAVKYLAGSRDGHSKYFEAVKRIFRDRIRDLERFGKSELVTGELRCMGDELEAAIWDDKGAKKLMKMNTRNEALEAVKVYLKEAWALLGPPFLESAATATEPSGIQRPSGNAGGVGVKSLNQINGKLAAKNKPNAAQYAGESAGKQGEALILPNVGELAAKTVNQVEEVATVTPNEGDFTAKLVDRVEGEIAAGNMPNARQDVGELAANTVNQFEEVAANMPNVSDLAVNTANPAEKELVVNTLNADQGVGESAAKTTNQVMTNILNVAQLAANRMDQFEELAANLQGADQNFRDNDRPELCDREARRSVALPSGSWDTIVRDRAAAGRVNETQQGNVPHRRKHVVWHKRSKAGVKIADAEELATDVTCNKYNSLPTPEVNKVRAALKSSSLELQAVVKDPLPDALRLAENVMNDRVTRDKKHETSVENQSARGRDAPNPSVNKSIEPTEIDDRTHEHQSCSNQNNAPRPSLMERNSTAHTFEWDDSIDDSPEEMTNHAIRLRLPSPKRKRISPLKKYETANFARRRKVKRWTLLEEETLRTGVQKYGKGNWKLILNCYRDIFEERTEVDLKDKWRNMTRS